MAEEPTAADPVQEIRWGRSLLAAALVLVVAGGLAAALIATRPEPQQRQRLRIEATVQVLELNPRPLPIEVHGFGSAEPLRRQRVLAEVSGRITADSPRLASGKTIAAGGLLLQIDAPAARQRVARAEARLSELRAQRAELSARHAVDQELAAVEADTVQQLRQALEAERQLVASGRSSQRLVEERQTAFNRARATLLERQAAIQTHPHRLEALAAAIAAAQAELDEAEELAAKTRLYAPWDGVVVTAPAQPGDPVLLGQELYTLAAAAGAEARLALPPPVLATLLGPGQPLLGPVDADLPASFELDLGAHSLRYPGRLDRIEASLAAGTREAVAVVALDTSDRPQIHQDVFGRISIRGREVAAFRIPMVALDDRNQVWVVVDGRLEQRAPTILHHANDAVLVAADDPALAAGDHLVLTQLGHPHAGMRVQVETAAEAPPEPE